MNEAVNATFRFEDSAIGCLLGTAVGDAIGLPAEGLSKRRIQRLFGEIDRHRFIFGRGMVSDDTEHACMVAQALISSGGDPDVFMRDLSLGLRFWMAMVPAGIGFATARAIIKLWLGYSGEKSGVYSAGNGPAMRSPIVGVFWNQNMDKLLQLVKSSTRITHTDPKAEFGAVAIALATSMACSQNPGSITPETYLLELKELLPDEAKELFELIEKVGTSITEGQTTEGFAVSLGLEKGVGGYIYHTVPVVLHAWFRHKSDFRSAIIEIVRCGGDTDTNAAVLGGIIGSAVGKSGIPVKWLNGIMEWPRGVRWIEQLGRELARESGTKHTHRRLFPHGGVLARNVFFLLVVLFHGIRRMLPPY